MVQRDPGEVYTYSMRELLSGAPSRPYFDLLAHATARALASLLSSTRGSANLFKDRDVDATTIRVLAAHELGIRWVTVTPLCTAVEAAAVMAALDEAMMTVEVGVDVRLDERCLTHDDCLGRVTDANGEPVHPRVAEHLANRCVLWQRERARATQRA